MRSSAVSSTWPARLPCSAKASVYRATRSPCPTEAVACAVARSCGRTGRPSGAMPAAIAPEETRTTSWPAARRSASTATRARSRVRSSRPSRAVSEEEPIFTTTRAARGMPARSCTGVTTLLCRGRILSLRCRPVAGLPLRPQLLPRPGLGVHPLPELATLLRPGGPRRVLRLLHAQVAAARAEELGPGDHRRLPVEDDAPLHRADDDLVSRLGPDPEELLLHAEAGEPVGEEADCLVVAEVGLLHPALRLGAADLVEDAVVAGAPGDGEAGVVDRARTEHDPLRGGWRRRGARLGDEAREREGQLAQALVAGSGDLVDRQATLLELGPDELGEVTGLGDVDLAEDDDARPLRQRREPGGGEVPRVRGELALDDVEVADGVAVRLEGGAVEDVDDDGAALDVPQEVQPQAPPLAGAGDEAGDVGDGVPLVTGLDDPEVRHERGERVVGDLRARGGHRGDETGLAGAGEADEGDIGDALELEDQVGGLPRLTEEREPGSLAPRRCQRRVAEPATTARGGDEPGAGADEVGQDLAVAGLDDGTVRDGQDEVLPALPVAQVPRALGAVRRPAVGRVVVAQQRGGLGVDLEDDVAAPAPVPTVGATEGLELLPAHGGDAVCRRCRRPRAARHGRRRWPSSPSSGRWSGTENGGGRHVPSAPVGSVAVCRSGLGSDHADRLAAALGAELDGAGRQGEQGVVLAAADVVTGMELRAALADEDLARVDELAAETLDAEALRVGVAAVPGGAVTLLRCHSEACFRVVRTGQIGRAHV